MVVKRNPGIGFWKRMYKLWEKRHGYHWGADLVSIPACGFHLFKTRVALKRVHAILYRSCPSSFALGKEALSACPVDVRTMPKGEN